MLGIFMNNAKDKEIDIDEILNLLKEGICDILVDNEKCAKEDVQ